MNPNRALGLMRLREILSVLVVVAAAAVLGGCGGSGGTVSNARPVPDVSSSARSGEDLEVPRVDKPLDVSRFVDDPCRLVDQQALDAVGDFGPGKPDVDSEHAKKSIGPRCSWYANGPGMVSFSVVIDLPHQKYATADLKGLGGVYGAKKSGLIDYLEPIQLPGHADYPAVIAGDKSSIDQGRCSVHIGVADDLTVAVNFTNLKDPSRACPAAQQIGASVLGVLKSAN